jgi:RNA polymerase-binding transcription factor
MDLQLVEAQLKEKLEQLEDRLAHVNKDMSKSHSADSSEQAVERENDEVLEGIGQETQVAIQDIRAALARIGEGSYGTCSDCGEAINPDRLEVLPETTHCVSCAAS